MVRAGQDCEESGGTIQNRGGREIQGELDTCLLGRELVKVTRIEIWLSGRGEE